MAVLLGATEDNKYFLVYDKIFDNYFAIAIVGNRVKVNNVNPYTSEPIVFTKGLSFYEDLKNNKNLTLIPTTHKGFILFNKNNKNK